MSLNQRRATELHTLATASLGLSRQTRTSEQNLEGPNLDAARRHLGNSLPGAGHGRGGVQADDDRANLGGRANLEAAGRPARLVVQPPRAIVAHQPPLGPPHHVQQPRRPGALFRLPCTVIRQDCVHSMHALRIANFLTDTRRSAPLHISSHCTNHCRGKEAQ